MPSPSRLTQPTTPLSPDHAYKYRRLRVATIGAGFSGLILAHKIQHDQPELQDFIEHVIFEANSGIGGTWRVNTYPGVQCDVPAHLYVQLLNPIREV
jgi:cation diffusion facilitator CzcD-associated flavoprotein CzcO